MAEQTLAQLEGRMEEIAGLLERLHAHQEFTEADQKRFSELNDEYRDLAQAREEKVRADALAEVKETEKRRRERLNALADAATDPTVSIRRGDNPFKHETDDDPLGEPGSVRDQWNGKNPFDLSEMRTFGRTKEDIGGELRARAFTAIERMQGTNDKTRQTMTDIISRWDTADGKLAQLALLTGSPTYLRAFQKALTGNTHLCSPEERESLTRAQTLTDNAGGYAIPFQLDPTIIITSAGTYNGIRAAARKVVATGDVWNGVSAAAVSWSWDAEAAEVSDDAVTFAGPAITVHKAAGFVPFSLEVYQDIPNVSEEFGRLLAFGKETLENTAFTTGSGSGQPFGIVTAVSAASAVAATSATALVIGDLYALDEALPARHRMRASWLGSRTIYNDVRGFDTAGGAGLWVRLGEDQPQQLIGRPAYESEAMDSTMLGTTTDYTLVFGDFENYVIADRIGASVEYIPHLFGTTNNRPTGQRGLYAWYRVGADSVNDDAFRILRHPTT
jgi:HK97 family phage major capsid protein